MIRNAQVCNDYKHTDIAESSINKDIHITKGDNNTRLSMQLADQRQALANLLTTLPLTSLWMLTKPRQSNDEGKAESTQKEKKPPSHLVQTCFHNCYSAAEQGVDSLSFKRELRALHLAQKDTPFMGEDIKALCALVLQLCSDDMPTELCQTVKTFTNRAPVNPKFQSLFDYYQRQAPGFLCPQALVSKAFLKRLVEHYQQWSNIRQQFTDHNYGLVRLLKQQYKGDVLSEEDLLQEGLIGLLKAIDRFDHNLGFKFSTYATYWIRQAMSRALTRGERTVRLPFAQMASINKLCQAKEKLLHKTGREPSDQELADELRWKVSEVNHLQNISQVALSLDESYGDEQNDHNLLSHLQQDCHESPVKQQSDQQLRQLFAQSLSLLNTKERLIICWRFGFNGSHELTLEEIGKQLNLTRERVRQIQALAMEKIKSQHGTQLKHFLA